MWTNIDSVTVCLKVYIHSNKSLGIFSLPPAGVLELVYLGYVTQTGEINFEETESNETLFPRKSILIVNRVSAKAVNMFSW